MAIGAYSLVRYVDSLNDQRINLGVIAFHPFDGYVYKHLDSLTRLRAVDDSIDTDAVEAQLSEIAAIRTERSRRALDELCKEYRHAVVITEPYPARISSANAVLERLFDKMVTRSGAQSKDSPQKRFEKTVYGVLVAIAKRLQHINVRRLGKEQLNGVSVNLGIHTAGPNGSALWHALSLEAKSSSSARIERAKSTAMDALAIKSKHKTYSNERQIVAVQTPTERVPGIDEALEWIKESQAADLLTIEPGVPLEQAITQEFQSIA